MSAFGCKGVNTVSYISLRDWYVPSGRILWSLYLLYKQLLLPGLSQLILEVFTVTAPYSEDPAQVKTGGKHVLYELSCAFLSVKKKKKRSDVDVCVCFSTTCFPVICSHPSCSPQLPADT